MLWMLGVVIFVEMRIECFRELCHSVAGEVTVELASFNEFSILVFSCLNVVICRCSTHSIL